MYMWSYKYGFTSPITNPFLLTHFQPAIPLLCSQQKYWNLWFSDVFSGYKWIQVEHLMQMS